jgi:type I restriction enzyme, S subunit
MDQRLAFPRYDSYRATGLEWLGVIPSHWELKRKKYLFSERVQKGFPDEPLLAATQSQGVVRKTDYDSRTVEATKDFHLLKLVKQGDFVISLRSFEGGIEFAHYQGIISPAYTVLTPLPEVEAGFYRYFFKSLQFIQSLKLFVTGIREGQNIDYTKLSRAFLPYPPASEAKRIANFLDQKTAEIDEAIAKKQRLIDLLKEQKAILINQAVTKGLNPDVPTRDSGVEWIGEVPKHWVYKKIKHLVTFISGGTPSKDIRDYWAGNIPWVSPKDMKRRYLSSAIDGITEKALKRTNLKLLNPGCVLIVVRGMILSKKIPVAISTVPLTINQDMKAMVPSVCCFQTTCYSCWMASMKYSRVFLKNPVTEQKRFQRRNLLISQFSCRHLKNRLKLFLILSV